MVYTLALRGLPHYDFGAHVCTIMVLGPFGYFQSSNELHGPKALLRQRLVLRFSEAVTVKPRHMGMGVWGLRFGLLGWG